MVYEIHPINLLWLLVPVTSIACISKVTAMSDFKSHVIPIARMLVQLVAIGFLLKWIFAHDTPFASLAMAFIMVVAASWIGLRHLRDQRKQILPSTILSISISGSIYLTICLLLVLKSNPWYNPRIFIPIAGMLFANSMTGISITCERLLSELKYSDDLKSCQRKAFSASIIPITNACLAIGLVSLPGMMTGQILSGVSPLIAVRYQAMIMLSMYGSVMTTVLLFLHLTKSNFAAYNVDQKS